MTSRGTEPLPMAPYSVELLADLHAGVLPESISTKLWPLVEADADARRILASLDAVSARLRAVGADLDGGESMPPDVAERIDRTLAGAGNAGSTGSSRGLPRSVRPLLIAAAASIVIAVATTLFVRSASTSEPDVVAGPGEESVLTLQSSLIDDSVVQSVMANRDPVQLVEAGLLPDCLQANGIDRNSVVLGAAAVDIDGSEGTMLVLSRGPDAGLTVLAVGAGCGVDDPQPLFRRDLS